MATYRDQVVGVLITGKESHGHFARVFRLKNCASHSRYFSDELDAQIFYSKKERMFTYGTICAKI